MSTLPAGLSFLRMTARDIVRQPVRSLLTVIGVAFGVVAIVAFSSSVSGLTAQLETAIQTGGSDMMVYQGQVAADVFSSLPESETRSKLRSTDGIERVAGALFHPLPTKGQVFTLFFGLRTDEFILQSNEPIEGRRPAAPHEVLLGTIASENMQKGVGDQIEIVGETFEVVGVFESEVGFFNGGAVMLLDRLQEFAGREDRVTTFMVKLKAGADLQVVRDRVESQLGNVVTITNAAEYSRVDQGLDIAKKMVWIVSALSIVVGGVVVMNTMWMTVMERTREIGVLRALGWSSGRVLRMVLIEALLLGLLASLVGSVLGILLSELTRFMPVANQFNEPQYGWATFALAAGVAVVLSQLGALLPAWRATQISPAEALRYE